MKEYIATKQKTKDIELLVLDLIEPIVHIYLHQANS